MIIANSENIKRCLKMHGCSQTELANALGVTLQSVNKWWKGDIPLTKLQDIAEYLGVSVSELIGEKEPEQQTECDTVTIQGKKYKVAFTPIDE